MGGMSLGSALKTPRRVCELFFIQHGLPGTLDFETCPSRKPSATTFYGTAFGNGFMTASTTDRIRRPTSDAGSPALVGLYEVHRKSHARLVPIAE